MSINVNIAVGVGTKFAIVSSESVKHIVLQNTHTIVEVDGETYPLYKGATYDESRKVDNYFDNHSVEEMDIKEYLANREKEYDVTITRFGCAKICATSAEEAMEKANALAESDIAWNEDWSATDAIAEE